jgi:hypothetical protein
MAWFTQVETSLGQAVRSGLLPSNPAAGAPAAATPATGGQVPKPIGVT